MRSNGFKSCEYILGISAYYHDSAAVLLKDGKVVAAVQEERFTRKKNDERFPEESVKFVLQEAGIAISDLDVVAFYDKPGLKFERIMETFHENAPKGFRNFLRAIPSWMPWRGWTAAGSISRPARSAARNSVSTAP